MKGYIDLHLHSSKSDGKFTPIELVDKAAELGLRVIAVTDHDTINGVSEALTYSKKKKKNIEVIPGVEVSCDEEELGFYEIHILGLFIDVKNPDLNALLDEMKKSRITQKKKIISRLNRLGIKISFGEVKSKVRGEIGRPHIAEVMVKKYPKFKSIRQVFDKYIGREKKAYVEKEFKVTIKKAVETIHKAKGIAILAHPGVFKKKNSLELISVFKSLGGDGIETFYPYHKIFPQLNIDAKGNIELINFYRDVAKKRKLLESGGSDFHGEIRKVDMGELKISYNVFERLKKAGKKRKF